MFELHTTRAVLPSNSTQTTRKKYNIKTVIIIIYRGEPTIWYVSDTNMVFLSDFYNTDNGSRSLARNVHSNYTNTERTVK